MLRQFELIDLSVSVRTVCVCVCFSCISILIRANFAHLDKEMNENITFYWLS